MHLTNYAINKNSDNFQFNDNLEECDVGHKRSIDSVFEHLERKEPDFRKNEMWSEI